MLTIHNLCVAIESKPIIDNLSLKIKPGEIHALMGPNGSGKSTLSLALAGEPKYQTQAKAIQIDKTDVTGTTPDRRAQAGLFLSFQHPITISGLSVRHLLKLIQDHCHPDTNFSAADFKLQLAAYSDMLGIKPEFLSRDVNDGFSGGEKKRLEMLQLLVAEPKYAILDEIDSGLDVDAIKLIADTVLYAKTRFHTGFIIVTHYRRILDYIHPDAVHVLVKGTVVQTGGPEIIEAIDAHGYAHL